MLLITRRPSATTLGMAEKSELRSTSWAAWQAASEPEAMAMPQSASFRASTSLTPSPVMATVWPCFWRARTSLRFWLGVTRPNTVYSRTARSKSASLWRVAASTYFSAPEISACRATSATVTGLSPEMTLTATPCSAK